MYSSFQKSALTLALAAFGLGALVCVQAQAPGAGSPGRPGGPGGPPEYWWSNKTEGGVYKLPMRPLWKLSDLKRMHAGQNSWSEQIILDPEQDATYNSAEPGRHFGPQLHPDTPTVFVVVAGQVHFAVEGQQPVTATRGSIVNIMKTTLFSYDVVGSENALWVEINPTNYKTVYPADGPQPAPSSGGRIVKVAFPHKPGAYTPPNQLHWNTFDDTIAKCAPPGPVVLDDHLFASPLLGYLNPADNKCGTGRGNAGGGPAQGAFDPHSTFGHMHAGPAEWWIVQVGAIRGRFENAGEFHAVEGDVLYVPPMSWHEMGAEAPSGPSVRLAMGGYALINMFNTEEPGRAPPAAATPKP
jgi:mannose-6-phosphate isomerase-like protein (cupin superfamily)